MSGLYSTRPAAGGAIAAAAVAAVEGLTRALALDLAPIRVNAVAFQARFDDAPATQGHDRPFQRGVGLQTNNDFGAQDELLKQTGS